MSLQLSLPSFLTQQLGKRELIDNYIYFHPKISRFNIQVSFIKTKINVNLWLKLDMSAYPKDRAYLCRLYQRTDIARTEERENGQTIVGEGLLLRCEINDHSQNCPKLCKGKIPQSTAEFFTQKRPVANELVDRQLSIHVLIINYMILNLLKKNY